MKLISIYDFFGRVVYFNHGTLVSAASILFDVCSSSFAAGLQLDTSAARSASDGVRHDNLIVLFSCNTLLYHCDESFINTHSFLRGCFKIWHVVIFFAPCLCLVSVNFSLRLPVYLVAYQNEWERFWIVRAGVFDEAVLPFIQSIETSRVRQIIAEGAAVSPTVERKSQRLEFLLTGCIPNLERYHLPVDLNFLFGEVSAYGWLGVGRGLVMDILLQKSCFSNT